MAASVPILPDGVRPNLPIKPAHKSLAMSPYKLGSTSTSNDSGRAASWQ